MKMPRIYFCFVITRIAAFCFALLALLTATSQASEWQAVENTSDGIQIFKRELPGSSLIAFRGIGVVDAPLPLVATIIFDTDRGPEWIEDLLESRIIHWIDKDEFVEYDRVGMPFIVKDRDFVSKIKMSVSLPKKEMIFHYQPTFDSTAPQTDYVRGELIDTTYILSSIEGDRKTRVVADFVCDPKGLIPKWLINFFQKDWPKTTFRNLRKETLKSGLTVDSRFTKLFTQGIIAR